MTGKKLNLRWGTSSGCRDLIIDTDVKRTTQEHFEGEDYSVRVLYALAAKQVLVDGSYKLSARYCAPATGATNGSHDTLQLLVHGATFSKIMWDFPYQPERYSWVKRMNREGYPTLAVDLVGKCSGTHAWGPATES